MDEPIIGIMFEHIMAGYPPPPLYIAPVMGEPIIMDALEYIPMA